MPERQAVGDADISAATRVISALDSPLRMKILALLNERSHVVHELVSALEKSQPLVSQHLRVLKKAGLVNADRMGREVVYSLAAPEAIELILNAAAIAGDLEVTEPAAVFDAERDDLKELRSQTATTVPSTPDSNGVAAAALIGVPNENSADVDPGVVPQTPSPIN
ncbi:ArsR/SmtB family transcription factor [Corynebacterium lubricantis]|uniref:ArsR/SmtB family transcription factor n=1 Tax=Corynebacterium lubricantis TaxID=541095 RepID=UPI0003790C02|nr:metalloregulator ArsR/SmtB family transcription factor [Corynebacterium lubricantis]